MEDRAEEGVETIPPLPDEAIAPMPQPRRKQRLGDVLVELKLVTQAQVAEALSYQKVHGGRLGSALCTLGYLSESDLESSLGKQLGLAVCDVESINPSAEVLRAIPESLVRKYEVIPLAVKGKTLTLGMTDPSNISAIDEIKFGSGFKTIEIRLLTETTFRRFVATRYATVLLMDQIAADPNLDKTNATPGQPGQNIASGDVDRKVWEEDPDAALPLVVRLGNYVLEQSVIQRASDIHIEPYESFFRIRFRVDGCLYTVLTPPQRIHAPLVSRIKILSEMDISERRRPQDGHMTMRQGDEELHFRVSSLPTMYGEKVVIRLLKKEAHLADIARLGFRPEQLASIRKVAKLTQGLVLVTGPTGSGKTTTLHAMINHINDPDINIVTIEDPVECAIPGVNHVQTNEKGGLTFSGALRSILRQDPDVVFIGEMRDPDVCSIALKASLTGHLVLSTLHTNGIIETFNRLTDMGVEPYLLASSLQLVVAQRLIRRVCATCAVVTPIPEDRIKEFGLTPEQVATAVHKTTKGCRQCLDTGYRGRIGVYEMMVPTLQVREIIRKGADEDALRAVARTANITWMWDAGVARALAGETSFDEVKRVLTPPET